MLCIFCGNERAASLEHVFPFAIGGTVTTDRVCETCNSDLGSRVDAALSDFSPIRMRRAELRLAGNSGEMPAWYEMFLGEAKLIGPAADRVRISFDETTGKLDTRQLHHATEIMTPDGKKLRQITIDARDKGEIPKIIQRERKRYGLPPLSDEELAVAAGQYTAGVVENPLVRIDLSVSFAYLRHAMLKIAYELAFLWLGEAYLADSLAIELRKALCATDVASTDHLAASIGEAETCEAINKFWLPHKEHHIAFAQAMPNNQIMIAVRVFDIYAAVVVVTREAHRYLCSAQDRAKLRFLAIDAVSGRTIDTPFDEETLRQGSLMRAHRRIPPFADPLVATAS